MYLQILKEYTTGSRILITSKNVFADMEGIHYWFVSQSAAIAVGGLWNLLMGKTQVRSCAFMHSQQDEI